MSGGGQPISNSASDAMLDAESASNGLSGTAADAKESEARIAEQNVVFGIFCGFCLSNASKIFWKIKLWPELHLLAWVNAVLTALFCLGIYLLLKSLKRRSRPLPWLKRWVRVTGFIIIFFLVNAILSPLPRVLREQLIPLPKRVNYPDEAGLMLEWERVFSAWDQLGKLDGDWAGLCGFAFLLAAGYFKALPATKPIMPIMPTAPPPPPPVPRDEWWKKYY